MISLRQIIKEVVKEELPFENMDSAEKKLWRKFTKLIQRCGGDMETLFKGKGKIEFVNEEKEFVKIILVQLAREEGLSHKIWEDTNETAEQMPIPYMVATKFLTLLKNHPSIIVHIILIRDMRENVRN